jgi:hypothetical protein
MHHSLILAFALFCQGDGSFETWAYPVKIASHFRITAEMQRYRQSIPTDGCKATHVFGARRSRVGPCCILRNLFCSSRSVSLRISANVARAKLRPATITDFGILKWPSSAF